MLRETALRGATLREATYVFGISRLTALHFESPEISRIGARALRCGDRIIRFVKGFSGVFNLIMKVFVSGNSM